MSTTLNEPIEINGVKLERRIVFRPAYHKVDEGYGVKDMWIDFVVVGPQGAVNWSIMTGWHLPETTQWWKDTGWSGIGMGRDFFPNAFDLGIHHRTKPERPEYWTYFKDCTHFDGAECWYDGSGLAAEQYLGPFLKQGDEPIWSML